MLKTLITPEIIDYCCQYGVRETKQLSELRHYTMQLDQAQMLITPIQGALLKLLVQISQAKQVLEIGMFTGYSALWLALGLSQQGQLTTLDISERYLSVAQQYWHEAQVAEKITPIIAPAELTLQSFHQDKRSFDLIFIDANKAQYLEYYQASLELLNPHGLIIIDNVLMYGQVLDPAPQKKYVKSLQQLNQVLHQDPRVDICLLPVGDGLSLIRKKE
ncbi:MAG: hypothetical protein RLZZ293_1553 [Pseudomonadota bacterium]|jgi:predicted O-methyltransferase YrrM